MAWGREAGTLIREPDQDKALYLSSGFRAAPSPFLEYASPGSPTGSLPPSIQVSAPMPLCQGLPRSPFIKGSPPSLPSLCSAGLTPQGQGRAFVHCCIGSLEQGLVLSRLCVGMRLLSSMNDQAVANCLRFIPIRTIVSAIWVATEGDICALTHLEGDASPGWAQERPEWQGGCDTCQ